MSIIIGSLVIAFLFLQAIITVVLLNPQRKSTTVGAFDKRRIADNLKMHNHWYCVDDMVSLLKESPVILDFDTIVKSDCDR